MADRKSNRRKKVEIPESKIIEGQQLSAKPPVEEKRKIYPSTVVSVTWDALNTKRKVNDDLKTEISDLNYEIQKKPSAQIEKLNQLIQEYPDLQIFQGYLLMVYIIEEDERAVDIAENLFNKYPDFMFGKIGFIESAILRGDLNSIPDFLEDKYDYKQIFPQRGAFHIVEVLHFYFSLGRYYAVKGMPNEASIYMEHIKSIDEDHIFLKKLQKDMDKGSGVKFYQKVLRRFKK